MVNHTHNDVILRYFLYTVNEVRDVQQPDIDIIIMCLSDILLVNHAFQL